ncbi:MAG: ATPase [Candidatus Tokpelaia sp. JSC189]|nr:MAG: ATPase [Candidatus Tokpelaia sp. JSC189]
MHDIFTDAMNRIADSARKVREQMKIPLPKRFYKEVSAAPYGYEDGFAVLLDGSRVMTPALRPLNLPTKALADLIADEFRLQREVIDRALMPVTRLANTVIDGIVDDSQPIVEDILRFVATDMLFYRAVSPRKLAIRQNEQWNPLLDWVEREIGAYFVIGEGVMHIEQPYEAVLAVSLYLRRFTSPFALAALHAITTLTGSALIALGIATGEIDIAKGWRLAYLDEDWTAEQWGQDIEAMAHRSYRKNEMHAAVAVLATI